MFKCYHKDTIKKRTIKHVREIIVRRFADFALQCTSCHAILPTDGAMLHCTKAKKNGFRAAVREVLSVCSKPMNIYETSSCLPALVPQVGGTGSVVLTAKLYAVAWGIYCIVVNSHACCQHADGSNLDHLNGGSDICLFRCKRLFCVVPNSVLFVLPAPALCLTAGSEGRFWDLESGGDTNFTNYKLKQRYK